MKPFPRRLVCLEPCPLHFPRLKRLGHQHQWSTWSTMPSNGFIHNYALIWKFPKLGQLESQKTATSATKNVHVHSGNIFEIPWQVESQAILIFNKLLQVTVGYVLRFEPHVEANGLADCAVALPQLKHCDPTALEENSWIWNSAQNWGFEVWGDLLFLFFVVWFCWGLSFFSGLPDGSSSHTSWPWAAKPVLHHHDKIHRHQTTSPSPGGSPGPGSGMPPVKSSTSPGATSGKPATNIPAKPAK